MNKKDDQTLLVSYGALVLELGRRISCGWRPHDQEYFSDLVFNLLANERALERQLYDQRTRANTEMAWSLRE